MTKIFSQSELIEFNEKMLGRGMPVTDDGIGYNKADYGACALYYNGLSDAQCADLAKRLVKYTKTQLHIDRSDMKATADYYKNLAEGSDRTKGVSVRIINDSVILSFKYNERFIQSIRKQPARQYNIENKYWTVPFNRAIDTLLSLEKVGADVKNSIKFIESNLVKG